MVINGKDQFFDCCSVREKQQLYDAIYGYLRSMKTEEELRRVVRNLCACYRVDIGSFCRDLCMSWEEITQLAADLLCTIGAHTVNHPILKKVASDSAVRSETAMSRAVLEAALGKRPPTASGLSDRRCNLGWPARVPHRG